MNWTTLVQPEALAAHLDDDRLRLFDARFSLGDPEAGRAAHESAHLPGALYADLNHDLSDLSVRSQGRHPIPDEHRFAERLGQWGVTPSSQVVIYDAGDGGMAAARMWWLLKLIGHQRVAVLDGGYERWLARGLPITAGVGDRGREMPYPAGFDRSRIVSTEEVQARLGERAGWLLDARAAPRFRGELEPIDPVAGHVPGAVNRPYSDSLVSGVFKSAAELRAGLEPLLQGKPPEEVVLMCGSGVTACHALLAMEHAGLAGARVYAGSWSAWIDDSTRPLATGAD